MEARKGGEIAAVAIPQVEVEVEDRRHEALRHPEARGAEGDGDIAASSSKRSDSEALESVYSYAQRIKSFLGLEEEEKQSGGGGRDAEAGSSTSQVEQSDGSLEKPDGTVNAEADGTRYSSSDVDHGNSGPKGDSGKAGGGKDAPGLYSADEDPVQLSSGGRLNGCVQSGVEKCSPTRITDGKDASGLDSEGEESVQLIPGNQTANSCLEKSGVQDGPELNSGDKESVEPSPDDQATDSCLEKSGAQDGPELNSGDEESVQPRSGVQLTDGCEQIGNYKEKSDERGASKAASDLELNSGDEESAKTTFGDPSKNSYSPDSEKKSYVLHSSERISGVKDASKLNSGDERSVQPSSSDQSNDPRVPTSLDLSGAKDRNVGPTLSHEEHIHSSFNDLSDNKDVSKRKLSNEDLSPTPHPNSNTADECLTKFSIQDSLKSVDPIQKTPTPAINANNFRQEKSCASDAALASTLIPGSMTDSLVKKSTSDQDANSANDLHSSNKGDNNRVSNVENEVSEVGEDFDDSGERDISSNEDKETKRDGPNENTVLSEKGHCDRTGDQRHPEEDTQMLIEQTNKVSQDIVNRVIEEASKIVENLLNQKNAQQSIGDDKDSGLNNNSILGKEEIVGESDIRSKPESISERTSSNNVPGKRSGLENQSVHRSTETILSVTVEYEEDTVCGLGCFRPAWLQRWATPRMYVLLYSVIGILHGSYYTYLIGVISTLEKRFAFKSKVSGVVMVADELTPLFLGVVGGYYAGKGHRPRIIALGMLLSAGCCLVSALPYFFYGAVQHLSLVKSLRNETGPEFCTTRLEGEGCGVDERPPTLSAVLLLVLGSFLKGFGNLAYYAIGLAYMDDNSEKKDTPIFLAIALALRLLGPLVGFLMSSGFLKIYENPFEDPGFGPDDPRWIGAWWLGFVVQGVLLVVFTLPIALFPKRLPGTKGPDDQLIQGGKETLKSIFSGMSGALKRLWKNPIFFVMAINTTMKIFGHFGHAISLPKYMEQQFRLTASDASLFSGATSIFCIMVSTVLGGFLIWKYRPRAGTLLNGMILAEAALCVGFLLLMIPKCRAPEIAHFGNNLDGLVLDGQCNGHCHCSTTSFAPFCGPDGRSTYFSPCYAGCTLELDPIVSDKTHKVFGNCSCVVDANGDPGSQVAEGFCPDEGCWPQALAYICTLLLLVTVSNTFNVAHTIILLRSVHPSDKSVALGTFETFICLFGFIPFPVTFGALVDSACVIWEQSCGETGNCWFYDLPRYNHLLHGASSLFCGVSVCCLSVLRYLGSSRLKDLYSDNEEDPKAVQLDTVAGPVSTKL